MFMLKLKNVKNARESGILVGTIVLFIILSITASDFFSIRNFLNIARQMSVLGLMSVGLGLTMLTGNIDLSIGSIYGLSSLTTAIILSRTGNSILSIFIGLMIGMIIGLINGLLIVKIKINSFIATFGILYVARGLTLILTNGYPITLSLEGVTRQTNPGFYFIGQEFLFKIIPMQFIFMLILMIIAVFITKKMTFGLYLFAIGGNEKASLSSGIKVGNVKLIAYIISGFSSALAGILSLSFIGSVLPTAGTGLEFITFAAVIIGGVSMAGGEGSMLGVFIGVLLISMIKNGLVLLGINPFLQVLIIGVITILAVVYDSLTLQSRQERRLEI